MFINYRRNIHIFIHFPSIRIFVAREHKQPHTSIYSKSHQLYTAWTKTKSCHKKKGHALIFCWTAFSFDYGTLLLWPLVSATSQDLCPFSVILIFHQDFVLMESYHWPPSQHIPKILNGVQVSSSQNHSFTIMSPMNPCVIILEDACNIRELNIHLWNT